MVAGGGPACHAARGAARRPRSAADSRSFPSPDDAAEDRAGDRGAADLLGAVAGGRFAVAIYRIRAQGNLPAVGEREGVGPDPDPGRTPSLAPLFHLRPAAP